MVLCLVMCFSVFNVAAVVSAAEEAPNKKNLISASSSGFKNGKVTYTVSTPGAVTSLNGASFVIEFDPAVLKIVESETDVVLSSENFIKEKGFVKGCTDKYAIAFMSASGITKLSKTNLFKVTFEVIGDDRPTVNVEFYCREYITSDGKDTNDISIKEERVNFASFTETTLDKPVIKDISLTNDGIKIVWDEVDGAEKYLVQRKDSEGVWEYLCKDGIYTAEYTDTDVKCGEQYAYRVASVGKDGTATDDSAEKSITFISKPDFTVTNGNKLIKIEWKALSGIDGFKVLRRVSGEEKWTTLATVGKDVISYSDKNIESSVKYEYDVNAYIGTQTSITSESGKTGCYVDFPIIKDFGNEKDGLYFEWNAVKGAESYEVYRKANGDEEYSLFKTGCLETSITDTTAENGKSYKYAVKAVCEDGKSGLSEMSKFVYRVPTVTIAEVKNSETGIYIEWQGVIEAESYNIYRQEENSVIWTSVGSVEKEFNSFTDTTAKSGKTYSYVVTASVKNSEGCKNEKTEPFFYLKAPDCTAENKEKGVYVSWNISDGADEYKIYRADESGVLKLIATADEAPYVDTDVENGKSYFYRVVAVSTEKGESPKGAKSNSVCRIPAPENVKAQPADTGIVVSWDAVDVADSYAVYRKTSAGTYGKIVTLDKSQLSFVDESCTNNKKYQYYVKAVFDEKDGIQSAATDSVLYLKGADSLTAVSVNGGVKLTWSKVDGAKKYKIYKNGEALAETASTDYTINKITSGEDFYFFVRSMDENGNLYGKSETVMCKYLAMPTVTVSNASGGVSVKWANSNGADKYTVYRKLSSDSFWKNLGSFDAQTLSFKDTSVSSGKTYTYKVVSSNGEFNSAEAVSSSLKYLAVPEISSVATASTGITVKWKKVSGVSGYYIYRKTEDGEFSRIKTALSTATSYTDTGAKKGVIYVYTIKAYSGSAKSASAAYTNAVRLTAPKVTAANGNGYIKISWDTVKGAGSYRVYRKASGESGWTSLGNASSSETSYKDTTVKSGTKYYYTVKAFNGSCSGLYKSSSVIKYLAVPKLTSATSSSKGIVIKWGKVTGAGGYYVYRKTGSGSYSRIAKITKGATVSYTDTKAKKGTKYVYTVRSYSGSNTSATPTGINGVRK